MAMCSRSGRSAVGPGTGQKRRRGRGAWTNAGAVAGAAPVDLIIADYRLGDGTTGVDAIEALCAHIGRSVPAVIMTGDTSPSRIKEATASGHRILHKPMTGEECARSDRCSLC